MPGSVRPILILEDDPANSEMMQVLLEEEGYATLSAGTAAAGLELAGSCKPSLILLDLRLPDMDGLEVARRLKSDPDTRSIPVVAVTAQAMSGDCERALSAGCDAYLSKPVTPPDLLAVIGRFLCGPVEARQVRGEDPGPTGGVGGERPWGIACRGR